MGVAPEDIIRSEQESACICSSTAEPDTGCPIHTQAKHTVRERLVEALETTGVCDAVYEYHKEPPRERHARNRCRRCLALDCARAEPEEPCTTACDMPTEAHCTDQCPCWQAGYEAGCEAQREPAGRGTA
ncbi:unnamed protein product [marine sediment metagenome]|uniref:Uncharacterized protein n=1 Tax=marine sediment metagenome TaxID=412755 RepID=X0UBP4_9ZZZZ